MDFGLLLIILFIVAPLLERLLKAGQQPPEQGGPQVPRRPGQPLPRQQQRRMPTADGEEELPFRSVPAGHQRDEETAAGMLPDDLWEVLTGEKRPPSPREAPAEPPQPAPAPTAQVPPPPLQRAPDVAQRREIARLEQKRREEEERLAELRRGDQRRAERQHERDTMRNRPAAAPRDRTLPTVNVRDRNLRERPRSAGPPPGEADRYVRSVPVRTAPIVVSYDQNILGDEERHDQFHARLDREAAAAAAAAGQPGPRVFDFDDPTDLRRAIIMAEVLGRPKGLE